MTQASLEELARLHERAERLQAEALEARRRAAQALAAYRDFSKDMYGISPSTEGQEKC